MSLFSIFLIFTFQRFIKTQQIFKDIKYDATNDLFHSSLHILQSNVQFTIMIKENNFETGSGESLFSYTNDYGLRGR